MKKISDKDQLSEIFLSFNTDFEDSKITFNNGTSISFNGIQIDINDISGMPYGTVENFFSLSRASETVTPSNICDIQDNISKSFSALGLHGGGVSKISNYFVAITGSLSCIADHILGSIKDFVHNYLNEDDQMLKVINKVFPDSSEKALQIINTITGFVYQEAKRIEMIFKSTESAECSLFKSIFEYVKQQEFDENDRLKYFMRFVCDTYYHDGNLTATGLDEMKTYFAKFMTEQIVIYKDNKRKKENRMKQKRKVERIKCAECHGLCYVEIKTEKKMKNELK